jgi:hypothetical protein
MSAVIWFGIVAVWAFVLIPTWVRRSDIHWRRSGEAPGTRDKLGRAARVISRSGSRKTTQPTVARRSPVPASRRPMAADASRVTVSAPATATAIDTETAPETAPTAPAGRTAQPEDPMTTSRTARPAPRRSAPGSARPGSKPTPPPHVRRARRLVWIGATALATLMLAVLLGGWWVALNLIADVALFAYLRHLRGIAKQQQAARRARRSEGRQVAAPASRPTTPAPPASPLPRVTSRRERVHVRVPAGAPARPQAPVATASSATVSAPARSIDVTDETLMDDCPTTELIGARAI